jgi:NAD(P)-dependent dehydrogenase (short-subunit alcohol dehydrogenase family)
MGLTDKVAIVTGGSEGIGKYAALRMADEGAKVIIVARRQEVLDQAAQDIRTATEGVVLPVAADVADKDTADKVVQAALDNYGRLDILVNNAGVSMAKPFEDVSDEDWESDFELKVWGAIRLMRKSIPEMRKVGGGRIINVTNLGGRTPGASSMPTSISRATGIAITKGLSKDLGEDNILVNTIPVALDIEVGIDEAPGVRPPKFVTLIILPPPTLRISGIDFLIKRIAPHTFNSKSDSQSSSLTSSNGLAIETPALFTRISNLP